MTGTTTVRTTRAARTNRAAAPPKPTDPVEIAWAQIPATLFCADYHGHRFEIIRRIAATDRDGKPRTDGYSLLVDGHMTGYGHSVRQVKAVAADQAAVLVETPERRLQRLEAMYWDDNRTA